MCGDNASATNLVFPDVNVAFLEDSSAIAKDEVDGADDFAFSKELAASMHKQCVLVSCYLAPLEGSVVAGG